MRSSAPRTVHVTARPSWRIGIVHSSFYPEEVLAMVDHARTVLRDAGVPAEHVVVRAAPGSFEIPLIGAAMAQKKEVDALIALGIIVEGETHHARLVAEQAARGVMDVQLRHGMPFAFEILYVDDLEQAKARLDAGADAARTVLRALEALVR